MSNVNPMVKDLDSPGPMRPLAAGDTLTAEDGSAISSLAGGATSLVEKLSASGVTEVDSSVALTEGKTYRLVIRSLVATGAKLPQLQVSTDGGSTFESGAADYNWVQNWGSLSAAGPTADVSDDSILLTVADGFENPPGFSADLMFSQESGANWRVWGTILYQEAVGSELVTGTVSGLYIGATDEVDAIRISLSDSASFSLEAMIYELAES